jgi:hypothetical protein
MEIEYEELYWIFCGYKHTLPAAARGFVVGGGPEIDVAVGPSAAGVFDALMHALRYTLRIFALTCEIHNLNFGGDIDRIARAMMMASDRIMQAAPEFG